jgi:hypothetical protein
MLNNEITQRVENLYNERIFPNCPNYDVCKRESENFPDKPKMSYIGRKYGNHQELPKLLFLSLDSGDTKDNYSTIEELQNHTEQDNILSYEKNLHWFQTFNLAVHILKPFLKDLIQNENDVKPFIVHANSAKCNQGKAGRNQADNILFRNCKGFVVEELPLYGSDLIVTQGNRAWDVLCEFPNIKSESFQIECTHKSKEIKLNVYVREMNGRKFLHIPMYHPSYYKGYWGQKKCLIENIDKLSQRLKLYIKTAPANH